MFPQVVTGTKIDLMTMEPEEDGGVEAEPFVVKLLQNEQGDDSDDSLAVREREALMGREGGPTMIVQGGSSSSEDGGSDGDSSELMRTGMKKFFPRLGGLAGVGGGEWGEGGGEGGEGGVGREGIEKNDRMRKEKLVNDYVGLFGMLPSGIYPPHRTPNPKP